MGERDDATRPEAGPADGRVAVPGHVHVEARPVLQVRCPVCGRDHEYPLTAGDLPPVSGARYWRKRCHGRRFYVRVPPSEVPRALNLAHMIAQQHGLSERWLGRRAG